jgi:hypothetical protein
MRMAPSGRLLFVFTNRGTCPLPLPNNPHRSSPSPDHTQHTQTRTAAHVLATRSLRASEPLGEFGALKVEWGCWGVGPERNWAAGGGGRELLVLGVPSAFSRDSVQERHFAWRVPDPPPSDKGEGGQGEEDEDDEEDEDEDDEEGPLRLEVTPDIIPGFKSACLVCLYAVSPPMCAGLSLLLTHMQHATYTPPAQTAFKRWSCARAGPWC